MIFGYKIRILPIYPKDLIFLSLSCVFEHQLYMTGKLPMGIVFFIYLFFILAMASFPTPTLHPLLFLFHPGKRTSLIEY